MTQSPTILVVEDDAPIRQGLVDALSFAGHDAREAATGEAALDVVGAATLDLVLLDIQLPGGMDGFEVLRRVRALHPRLPVIMLTARGAEDDRVLGLQLGADDYVVKPFSAQELLARVDAVLRRSPDRTSERRELRLGDRTVELDRGRVRIPDGTTVELSGKEAGLLGYLALHRGQAVERKELLHRVWGFNPDGMETRSVDMLVARVRAKVEDDPSRPRFIRTVRARGYMLAPEEE